MSTDPLPPASAAGDPPAGPAPTTSGSVGGAGDGAIRAARRTALSVSIATALYGISFGALAVAAGFTVWQTTLMSMLLFTGGSQFAIVGVIGAVGFTPTSVAGAIAASSLLATRHAVYGMQLAPILDVHGPRRLLAAQLTIDETAAVALAQPTTPARRVGFWTTAAGVWTGWAALSLVGALIGDRIPDPGVWGLDAAASAAFLALLWPRLRSGEPVVVAIAAGVVAIALTPAAPSGVPVLAAAGVGALIALAGLARRGRLRRSAAPATAGSEETR
jgi:predicted branched-subunit amino acid permease